MNFRNSGKMPLILVREFWNLVIEESVKSQGILLFIICGNPVRVEKYPTEGYTDKILEFVFYVKTDVSPLSTCMSKICKQEV